MGTAEQWAWPVETAQFRWADAWPARVAVMVAVMVAVFGYVSPAALLPASPLSRRPHTISGTQPHWLGRCSCCSHAAEAGAGEQDVLQACLHEHDHFRLLCDVCEFLHQRTAAWYLGRRL